MENRETKIVELPSGGKAEILTKWTFDEYLKIEAAELRMARGFSVSGGETTAEINHDAMRTSTMEAMMLAVKKLTDADGTVLELSPETFGQLDMDDGLALRAAVNGIRGNSKKK